MPGKIRITADSLGRGHVEIDDRDISRAVRGFTVRSAVDERVEVTLYLSVQSVEVTALDDPYTTILVNLDDATIEALTALGWCPPDGDRREYRIPRAQWEQTDLGVVPAEEAWIIDNQSPDAND